MTIHSPPICRVSQENLRELFNKAELWEKVKSGDLQATVNDEGTPREYGQRIPPGTVSQEVSYWDLDGTEVARVHQYLKPDGTIGASGRPDPRRVFIKGTLYRMARRGEAPTPIDVDAILAQP